MTDHDNAPSVIDLAALAGSDSGPGPIWTHQSADLNANLLVFEAGDGVDLHVNDEVDVLLVGVAGVGAVEIDGNIHALAAGQAIVISKGTRRAVHATAERFAYLSCHRRRAGLWPRPARKSGKN